MASPSSTASTEKVPTPKTWCRHTNSAGPNTGSPGQRTGEVGPPVTRHETTIGRFAQLGPGPTRRIPVDHHDAPIVGSAALLRLRQLAGVECAVAATADHADVAHDHHAGQTS